MLCETTPTLGKEFVSGEVARSVCWASEKGFLWSFACGNSSLLKALLLTQLSAHTSINSPGPEFLSSKNYKACEDETIKIKY